MMARHTLLAMPPPFPPKPLSLLCWGNYGRGMKEVNERNVDMVIAKKHPVTWVHFVAEMDERLVVMWQ